MYSGEPMLRDPTYTVIDQTYLDTIKSNPVFDFLTEGTQSQYGHRAADGLPGSPSTTSKRRSTNN